jgi:hypothetical protein
MLATLALLLAAPAAALSSYTDHNASDCCCDNLEPRSSKNLATSVPECAAQCAANSKCHAAVLVMADVDHQCQTTGASKGAGCCLQKGYFEGVHPDPHGHVVIDLGTSKGPKPRCAVPAPPPLAPPPPGAATGEALRPWYHLTRLSGEMNDPNGLKWRRKPDGSASYEMYYQHDAGPTYCYGSEGNSHAWAHASSPDMLRWTRVADSAHMTCASTGAGVTLALDFAGGPSGETWLSANLGSAPSGDTRDTNGTGRGLKLWVSNDSLANDYFEYLPPGTKTIDPVTKQNDGCVICPERVRKGPSNPPMQLDARRRPWCGKTPLGGAISH